MIRSSFWVSLAILALLNTSALGQDAATSPQDSPTRIPAEVTLADGTVISGYIVSETDTYVIIENVILGRMEINRSRIRNISYDVDLENRRTRDGRKQDPDYNSLLLVPTSETLPKGDVYYRNFELLFNNFGYAVTDFFNISGMAAFPITTELRIFSAGAKLRILARESAPVGLAASISGWFADDEALGTLSAIASLGDRRRSVTVAANYGFTDEVKEFFFFVGGDLQIASGFKLLFEYGNSESAITEGNDFKGIVNIGFRAFWEKVSFTFAGFRPLEDTGDFIAFPLVMFSAHF